MDQRELAEAAIAKLELGPRPPGEIRDQSASPNPWMETPHDKEVREHQERAKILEAMIGDLPGVVGSFVWINRPKARLGLHQVEKPSAFVRLETEGDRQLPFRTVQAITTILTGPEPGLTADAITVVDRRGHKYLDAGNPALSAQSHNRAQEEELTREILDQLDWIKGVRVSVQLPEQPGEGGITSSAREPKTIEQPSPAPATRPSTGVAQPKPSGPVIALNRPLSIEPETPTASPNSTPVASPDPAVTEPRPAVGLVSRESMHSRKGLGAPGRVWVKVPRSYYYQVSILPGRKEPALEDIQRLALRTEEQIKTGVGLVVPLAGPLAWSTRIDMIHDDLPLSPPPVLHTVPEARKLAVDWGIAGAMCATAAGLVTFGYWMLNGRRQASLVASAPSVLRYHSGASIVAGPSERLREFVRGSPDSAVSVLERWTNQGGDAP